MDYFACSLDLGLLSRNGYWLSSNIRTADNSITSDNNTSSSLHLLHWNWNCAVADSDGVSLNNGDITSSISAAVADSYCSNLRFGVDECSGRL